MTHVLICIGNGTKTSLLPHLLAPDSWLLPLPSLNPCRNVTHRDLKVRWLFPAGALASPSRNQTASHLHCLLHGAAGLTHASVAAGKAGWSSGCTTSHTMMVGASPVELRLAPGDNPDSHPASIPGIPGIPGSGRWPILVQLCDQLHQPWTGAILWVPANDRCRLLEACSTLLPRMRWHAGWT